MIELRTKVSVVSISVSGLDLTSNRKNQIEL